MTIPVTEYIEYYTLIYLYIRHELKTTAPENNGALNSDNGEKVTNEKVSGASAMTGRRRRARRAVYAHSCCSTCRGSGSTSDIVRRYDRYSCAQGGESVRLG